MRPTIHDPAAEKSARRARPHGPLAAPIAPDILDRISATLAQGIRMTIRPFNPPLRTLMGPGPSDVHPRVLAAMARPTIGHLDPAFVAMMDEVKQLLQYAFQTKNPLTLPVSAPGSAGMETCFANLVEPGDKVVVCVNGVFGGRMRENVERYGGVPVVVENTWGEPVDPQKLDDALRRNPDAKLVAFVQAETSTGVQSDAKLLAEIAHRHDALVIVDAVTSLGGSPLKVDEWSLDAVYSGSQKCLSCTPGLAPVTFNDRAAEKIRGRKSRVISWFLDLNLVMGYWGSGKRAYHHTAPINPLYGLHEALLMLKEEGLENSWARHQQRHLALRAGLEAMGLALLVAEPHRLPQLNAVKVPAGLDDAALRSRLLNEHNLEIGAGLGALAGKIVRIGIMGHAACTKNVAYCLTSLETVLADMRAPVTTGTAREAARQAVAN
jgi:alanine-glyoxylate transaminase / serine-glyoxylate transaminase / serine-pyruvate transaminase